jgi:UbiD family decarboxylase
LVRLGWASFDPCSKHDGTRLHWRRQSLAPSHQGKAATTRKNPILQTLVGPGEEHVSLAGIPTEASIHNTCEDALPGLLKNVYAHSAGDGKFLAILQIARRNAADDGNAKQAAIVALAADRELENVIIDEDVDLFDSNDVLWVMQTRYQGDIDTGDGDSKRLEAGTGAMSRLAGA